MDFSADLISIGSRRESMRAGAARSLRAVQPAAARFPINDQRDQ
jgi:hypothetical protein